MRDGESQRDHARSRMQHDTNGAGGRQQRVDTTPATKTLTEPWQSTVFYRDKPDRHCKRQGSHAPLRHVVHPAVFTTVQAPRTVPDLHAMESAPRIVFTMEWQAAHLNAAHLQVGVCERPVAIARSPDAIVGERGSQMGLPPRGQQMAHPEVAKGR